MRFSPAIPLTGNVAENEIWGIFKKVLQDEPGRAYLGYQPRHENGSLKNESDILLFHSDYGMCVIEVKGCVLKDIERIDGDIWIMRKDWYRLTMSPLIQAKRAMYEIQKEIKNYGLKKFNYISSPVTSNHLLALPSISNQAWLDKYGDLPSFRGAIIFKDDLTSEKLRAKLLSSIHDRHRYKPYMPPENIQGQLWDFCESKSVRERVRKRVEEQDSFDTLKNAIQYRTLVLDQDQDKIAKEIPPGAQRLRGLAGTGKTVLLTKRIARMHYEYPDWDIVFTFETKSLYQQILERIERNYADLLYEQNEEPKELNWNKVKVLHAWGGDTSGEGFYYNLARACGLKPEDLNTGKFEDVCIRMEEQTKSVGIPQLYDAVIIDEGQDLPPSFYRLAHASLREPKRLYWAYDEAQGIKSLLIPKAETIFGRDEKDSLVVDLRGSYPREQGGARKSHVMNKSYRCPSLLLMTGHAINMGLFRKEGVLQGVTKKGGWEKLGYEILSGDFTQTSVNANKLVTIARASDNICHDFDFLTPKLKKIADPILDIQVFESNLAEEEWVAKEVFKDINLNGFLPEQILITAIYGSGNLSHYENIARLLSEKGIETNYLTSESKDKSFRKPGQVTITHSFYAKGNEAWKVYVTRYNNADPIDAKDILLRRNEAFTAITRSRGWCVITGKESPIFDELRTCKDQFPEFSFPSFNSRTKTLKRINDHDDGYENPKLRKNPPKIFLLPTKSGLEKPKLRTK
ncbi:MAG: hypothetical protein AAFO95_05405 [Cyanobacteria bacterium J06600_6]